MWFSMTGAELPQPVQRSIFTCARSRPSKKHVLCFGSRITSAWRRLGLGRKQGDQTIGMSPSVMGPMPKIDCLTKL